jgi:hypothetical protein
VCVSTGPRLILDGSESPPPTAAAQPRFAGPDLVGRFSFTVIISKSWLKGLNLTRPGLSELSFSAIQSSEGKVTLIAVKTSKVGIGYGNNHAVRRTPAHCRPGHYTSTAARPDI